MNYEDLVDHIRTFIADMQSEGKSPSDIERMLHDSWIDATRPKAEG